MTKQSGTFRRLALILGIVALISAVGCSSAKKKEDEGGVPTAPAADENVTLGDSDSGQAMGLQTVHFPYDSFVLDSGAKNALQSNANILNEKQNLKIQIEGHCDQRGGIQYNIALGEKRANSTKKYLEDLGVAGDRMTVISFGKEKPIDSSPTDEAMAKNRRANFVITSH
jgi:peptidoglycan-associated lipoprotein